MRPTRKSLAVAADTRGEAGRRWDGEGRFGSGPFSGIVRGLFVDQIGNAMAARNALGVADVLESQLERMSAHQHREPGLASLDGGLDLKA